MAKLKLSITTAVVALVIIGIVLALTTFAAITRSQTESSSGVVHAQASDASASTEPMSAYSYLIYIDLTTGLYDAEAANGTICYSSTSASTVINDALNQAGSTVLLSAGTYPVTGLTLCDNDVLVGESMNSVFLQQSGNGAVITTLNYGSSSIEHGTVEDLTIVGKQSLYTGYGIQASNYFGVYENLYITNFASDGLYVASLQSPYSAYSALTNIESVTVSSCGGNGISVYSADSFISNCFVYGCNIDVLISSSGTKLENCHFSDAATNDMRIYGQETQLVGCTIETSAEADVYIAPYNSGPVADHGIISGCVISRASRGSTGAYPAVYLTSTSASYVLNGWSIVGCTVNDLQNGDTQDAIELGTNVTNLVISGDTMTNILGYAVDITSPTDINTTVTGCTWAGSLGINNLGTNTQMGQIGPIQIITPDTAPGTTAITLTAGRVYLQKFEVQSNIIVNEIGYSVQSDGTGNVTVGIYKDNGGSPSSPSTLLVSANVFESTSTYTFAWATIPSTTLTPGVYWVCIEGSSNLQTMYGNIGALSPTYTQYYYNLAGGYGALTSTITAATATNGNPNLWLNIQSNLGVQ
jgi:hypothetical protein